MGYLQALVSAALLVGMACGVWAAVRCAQEWPSGYSWQPDLLLFL